MAKKLCSIIIVYYSEPLSLFRCLRSIATFAPEDSHVIIINNSCSELSIPDLKSIEIKTINNTENVGFARACNQGAAVADGTWLLFLNPDTELTDDFVRTGIEYLAGDPFAGMVGPALVGEDNHIQVSAYKNMTISAIIQESLLIDRFLSAPNSFGHIGVLPRADAGPLAVDWLCGAALLVSKEVFEKIDGFSPEFFLFFEDVDLCNKVKNTGKNIIYLPTLKVRHFDKDARDLYNKKFDSALKIVAINRSVLIYWKKNGNNMVVLKLLLILRTILRVLLWSVIYPFKSDRDSVKQRLNGYWQVLLELHRGRIV